MIHLNLYLKIKESGASLNPPATAKLIKETEQRLDLIFPETLRQFYLLANGFTQEDSIWNFFPLCKFTTHAEYRLADLRAFEDCQGKMPNTQKLILIADAMIDAPSYWLCLDTDSPLHGAILGECTDTWIAATSFEQLLDKVTNNFEEGYIGLF